MLALCRAKARRTKGNIRQRLLSHWDHEKPADLAIWDHNPATFGFELSSRPSDRHANWFAMIPLTVEGCSA